VGVAATAVLGMAGRVEATGKVSCVGKERLVVPCTNSLESRAIAWAKFMAMWVEYFLCVVFSKFVPSPRQPLRTVFPKSSPHPPLKQAILVVIAVTTTLSVLFILSFTDTLTLTDTLSFLGFQTRDDDKRDNNWRYLYWGSHDDCPDKHCGSCAGLGHQESSLCYALKVALFLDR
jgi:hypothetical protein